jgi:uncharacterized protein (TIGR02266 family)
MTGMKDVGPLLREYAQLERKSSLAGLDTLELERWALLKRALVRHLSPGVSEAQIDRRQSLRVPMRLRVSFASTKDLGEHLMTNLSRKGVFISTTHLADIGTRLDLRIHIDETDDVIEVPATVVSHNIGPHFERGQQGMGMSFAELPAEVEKRLAGLYQKALEEHARLSEETGPERS